MENLKEILLHLKELGCTGIKISYEDEGALLNEIISMRYLTACIGLDLAIKIGGCEAKRDIVDCLNVSCDSVVSPMIESGFALSKFVNSIKQYQYSGNIGFNLETINGFRHFDEILEEFSSIDYITFGRVDFLSSIKKDRSYVNNEEIYKIVFEVFTKAKEKNKKCYLGGAISIDSKEFICKLASHNLLDKFETRYVIFDINKINFQDFSKLLYWANVFEVEWLRFISNRYAQLFKKDIDRIEMMEKRIIENKEGK